MKSESAEFWQKGQNRRKTSTYFFNIWPACENRCRIGAIGAATADPVYFSQISMFKRSEKSDFGE